MRDTMLEVGEKRLGETRSPQAIEHPSDKCSAYAARDTRLLAQARNLPPCSMPVDSPQSNGMSEAVVKTMKQDNIHTARRLIDGWMDDWNEIHPHSALTMASPRRFIRAKSTSRPDRWNQEYSTYEFWIGPQDVRCFILTISFLFNFRVRPTTI